MSTQPSATKLQPQSIPVRLTDIGILNAKPPTTGRLMLWDSAQPHFGVRITVKGTKSYVVIVSGRRVTIGTYGIISLAQARAKAAQILAERTLGRHLPTTTTWERAREEYLSECREKNRRTTYVEYARILKVYFPFNRRLTDITPLDVRERLVLIQTPAMRGHALTCLKIFFNWCIKREYIDRNPCRTSELPKSTSRARVLTDEELGMIWRACEQRTRVAQKEEHPVHGKTRFASEEVAGSNPAMRSLPASYCTIVQLLILTGQRRGEIAALQFSWIQNQNGWIISLPASLTKNGRPHHIPCSSLAWGLLQPLAENGHTKLLFAAHGSICNPFSGWSKSKPLLDKASGVTNWTLHDLRRTYATRMAELGVAPHVIERLLNHQKGSLSPIALVYNKATYLAEMREAVNRYEAWLTKLLNE